MLGHLVKGAKAWFLCRFSRWLNQRIPSGHRQQINHRNIFIVPSGFGAAFLCLIVLLFLLGTNYQNNIILLTSYLLISFFIVCLLHCFFNLSGLQFHAKQGLEGYAKQRLVFPLIVDSNKTRFNLNFVFSDLEKNHQKPQSTLNVAILSAGKNELRVPYIALSRGQFTLPRILIESEYAFGLFRTWTRLDFDHQATIFPEPIPCHWQSLQGALVNQDEEPLLSNDNTSHQSDTVIGTDEFHQLQSYKEGEPLSRVAWKQLARGQGWLTKHYHAAQSQELLFDFDQIPGSSLEHRLSLLSFAIKECQHQKLAFSVKLSEQTFPLNSGEAHVRSCLIALACFKGG